MKLTPITKDSEPINIEKYVPDPDKPGYLKLTGRMTWGELANACDAVVMAVPALAKQIEWHGISTSFQYRKPDDEIPPADSPIPKRWTLAISWEPGGSEGYIAQVTVNGFVVWNAKYFSCDAVVATTLQLSRFLFWHGSSMDCRLCAIIEPILTEIED